MGVTAKRALYGPKGGERATWGSLFFWPPSVTFRPFFWSPASCFLVRKVRISIGNLPNEVGEQQNKICGCKSPTNEPRMTVSFLWLVDSGKARKFSPPKLVVSVERAKVSERVTMNSVPFLSSYRATFFLLLLQLLLSCRRDIYGAYFWLNSDGGELKMGC